MSREINKIEKSMFFLSLLIGKKYKIIPLKLKLRFFKDFFDIKIIKIKDKLVLNYFFAPAPGIAFERNLYAFINHKNSLLKTHISVTNNCPLNCSYCSNKYKNGEDMPLEKIKELIKKLQDKNISQISFTGGEPLLRKDILEIIKSVGDKSVSYVLTSGYDLTNEKALDLKKAGLFGIAISLDSYNKKINDNMRCKGSFDIALKAVKNSKDAGLYTIIQMVVKKETIKDLESSLKFFKTLGVDEVLILEIFPCGSFIEKDNVVLSIKEKEKIAKLHLLSNKRKDFPKITFYSYIESERFFGCIGGYNYLYIDANGEVCPCEMALLSFGNFLREDFKIIWKRLRRVFSKPSHGCFALENIGKVRKEFKGAFPLSYENSCKICKGYYPKKESNYYGLLK